MAERKSVHEVEQELRALLERHNLGPQDRLPSERALADLFGCSRETVRKALRRFERDGVLWRHQGQGTFVGGAPATVERSLDRVIDTVSSMDLMEARLVYEPALAAAAARSATPEDLVVLRRLAAATGAARDWREYETLDDAFHKAVARASGNALLAAMLTSLASVRGRAAWQRRHDAIFREARKREYATAQSAMHMAVVTAIEAGDSVQAHASMKLHLEAIRRLLILCEQPGRVVHQDTAP